MERKGLSKISGRQVKLNFFLVNKFLDNRYNRHVMTINELKRINYQILCSYYNRAAKCCSDITGIKQYEAKQQSKNIVITFMSALTTRGWLMKNNRFFDVCSNCSSLDELDLKLTLAGY